MTSSKSNGEGEGMEEDLGQEEMIRGLVDHICAGHQMMDLPWGLQDKIIALWGDRARQLYLNQLRFRLPEPQRPRQKLINQQDSQRRRIEKSTKLLPALKRLASFPNTKRLVFNMALQMCRAGGPRSGDDVGECDRWSERDFLFWQLDDASVEAAVRLFRHIPPSVQKGAHVKCQTPIPDALIIVQRLRTERAAREKFKLRGYASRLIQFLEHVSAHQNAFITSHKILTGVLPEELIDMVRKAMVSASGATINRFAEAWSAPRPATPVCPTEAQPLQGCGDHTCSRRTWAEWDSNECRWISVHGKLTTYIHSKEQAVCNRPCGEFVCAGHHDEDFQDDDWVVRFPDSFGFAPSKDWKGGFLR